ncbi:G1/S-specific cyclin-D1-like [Clavelina lepadiformis]|uniref:Cyclin N-terminal domain-containing protein n=1 Tax=Clavelina lepadiformis TaxID=159417 RepID=A0ABP0G491_CLALP
MSLACSEICTEQRVIHARNDPAMYDQRVLRNMLELEERYLIRKSYFDCVQRDVQPFMRKIVSTWMMQVCEEQRCEKDVFPLAMNYLDRYLSVCPVSRTQLQPLGSACMLLASKVKETLPLTTEKLVIYTDYSVRQDELLEFELLLLMQFKWDVLAITPIDFVDQLLFHLHLDPVSAASGRDRAIEYIHCCCTDDSLMSSPPSMIAACCVVAAASGFALTPGAWFSRSQLLAGLQEATGVDSDILHQCFEQVDALLRSFHSQSSPHAHKHGSQDECGCDMDAGRKCRKVDDTPTDVDLVF